MAIGSGLGLLGESVGSSFAGTTIWLRLPLELLRLDLLITTEFQHEYLFAISDSGAL